MFLASVSGAFDLELSSRAGQACTGGREFGMYLGGQWYPPEHS